MSDRKDTTKIKIPFNGWSLERIKEGSKEATSRYKRYGKPGDIFEVEDETYQIDFIAQLPLWFIRKYLFFTEGAILPEEFEEVWTDIHKKKGFRGNDLVWYHHFTLAKKIYPSTCDSPCDIHRITVGKN